MSSFPTSLLQHFRGSLGRERVGSIRSQTSAGLALQDRFVLTGVGFGFLRGCPLTGVAQFFGLREICFRIGRLAQCGEDIAPVKIGPSQPRSSRMASL